MAAKLYSMQLLFCFIALFISNLLYAQQMPDVEILSEGARQFKIAGKDTLRKMPFSTGTVAGNKIRILADGMPCIVPDTRSIVPIPNALSIIREPEPGRIPNAWNGKMKVTPVK